MTQRNLAERRALLRAPGIFGSLSRSPALGADDPRNRSAADRELDFTSRFNPDQFETDGDGRVILKTAQRPTSRMVEIDIYHKRESGAANTPELRRNAFAHGEQLIIGNGDEIQGAMWILPGDLDRKKDAVLHLRWFRRPGATATGSTVSWDVDILAWRFNGAINVSRTFLRQVVDGQVDVAGGERGATLIMPHSGLFVSSVRALKFKIRRVASSDDLDDDGTSAPVLHFVAMQYPLADYHIHG